MYFLYIEHRGTPLTCLGGTHARKWESTTLRASLFPLDCRTGWCEFGHRAELINTNLLSAAITLTLQHQPPLPCLLSPVSQTRVLLISPASRNNNILITFTISFISEVWFRNIETSHRFFIQCSNRLWCVFSDICAGLYYQLKLPNSIFFLVDNE